MLSTMGVRGLLTAKRANYFFLALFALLAVNSFNRLTALRRPSWEDS
jgi:hypothetical protein